MSDVIQNMGCGAPTSFSNHSILKCYLNIHSCEAIQEHNDSDHVSSTTNNIKRFNVKKVPIDFLKYTNDIQQTIQRIESKLSGATNANSAYDDFVTLLHDEMDKAGMSIQNVKDKHNGKKSSYKPYWNDDLKTLWDKVSYKEHRWLKCPSNDCTLSKKLKHEFCLERKKFDKLHRKYKRQFQNKQVIDLQHKLDKPNSRDFWRDIGKIGIGNDRKPVIPLEVIDDSGTVIRDTQLVLDKWRTDYGSLYSIDDNSKYDNDHLRNIKDSVLSDTVDVSNHYDISVVYSAMKSLTLSIEPN